MFYISDEKKWDCSRREPRIDSSENARLLFCQDKPSLQRLGDGTVPDFFGLVRKSRKKLGTALAQMVSPETRSIYVRRGQSPFFAYPA